MIIKQRNKFVLYTKDGSKILGIFNTKEAALKREKQIIHFKNKDNK